MSNWYVYEQLSRIRQDEIRRDARSVQLSPFNLHTVLANRKVLIAVGLPVALILIINVLASQLTLY
jgi:hypothetical protein